MADVRGKSILLGNVEKLSYEETLQSLECLYLKKLGEKFPEELKESVLNMKMRVDNSYHETAEMLKEFSIKQQKLVKIHSEKVPDGILPYGYTATLHDMKVNARNCPDDEVYSKNPDVQKKIPRGTTTMELLGKESWHDVMIYANKKFTGGVGDEDKKQPNDDDTWLEYCLEPLENAVKIICMEKLNGDAVHFSGRYISGRFYLIAGSKNVHMLISEKSDIDLYNGSRFHMAKIFAHTVCDTLETFSKDVLQLLFSFLHHTKVTAICEVLQPEYQHIVNLSYLEANELNFITFTSPASTDEETTLTAFQPHQSLKLAKALGFACASYTEIEPKFIMKQRHQIRAYHNKEGEVLYYLNKDGETFGITKAKSVWYICLRALREKAVFSFTSKKAKPNRTLNGHIATVHKRYGEIQEWLKLSHQCLESWKSLGASFMRWLSEEIENNGLDPKLIRPKFPVLWKRFLEAGNDDIIPL